MGVEVGYVVGSKYRLLRQIGEGGMGSVWSAVHLLLDRTVAIKFLHLAQDNAPAALVHQPKDAAEHFAREAKSAARVSHRYIVDVFDFGVTEDGVHYMVQELLTGEEVSRAMDEGPAWDVRDVVRFMAQCLTGLEAVHRAGLVHRDIKPENLFIARDAEGPFPKLLDFGICHLRAQSAKQHEGTRYKVRGKAKHKGKSRVSSRELAPVPARPVTEGTPAYMAPEQLRGLYDIDGRADLYSVAVTLYEWLSGRLPYEQVTPEELCAHIAARSALPLDTLRPDIGPELSAVVARALSPEPHQRYESAAEMRSALLDTLPRLSPALSVVQKSLATGPMGSKTERILSAASCPFVEVSVKHDDEEAPELPMVSLWRSRAAHLAVAAIGMSLLGFAVLPRANAPEPRTQAAEHASAFADEPTESLAVKHGAARGTALAVATGAVLPAAAAVASAQTQPSPAAASAVVPTQPIKAQPARSLVLADSQSAAAARVASELLPRPSQAPAAPRALPPVPKAAAKAAKVAAAKPKVARVPVRGSGEDEARDHSQATAERLRGGELIDGLTIAVQRAAPVEAVVEERELTVQDMRRLGM
jgi:serine/threonine protein kinase